MKFDVIVNAPMEPQKSSSSPLKINSFYIVAIRNNQAITKNAIL